MRPIELPEITPEAHQELEELYRKTHDIRVRTRAQMILLAAEKRMVAAEIAEIVRENEQTVRRWLRRYLAEGVEGLKDAPRTGSPKKVTPAYQELLVQVIRQRPRSLDQPYSMWTLQRLVDYMAEQTGIRISTEAVRLHLEAAGIVLSRPQHTISSPDPEYEVKKKRSKSKEIT